MKPARFLLGVLLLLGALPPRAGAADKPIALFLGSSTIAFWDSLAQDFPAYHTVNLGKAGSEYNYLVAHAAEWAQNVPETRKVVLYSGDNDIANDKIPETIAANFAKTADALHAGLPHAQLFVVSIKPSPSRAQLLPKMDAANDLIQADVRRRATYMTFVDVRGAMMVNGQVNRSLFRDDMLHMNAAGYEIWTKLLSQAFRKSDEVLRDSAGSSTGTRSETKTNAKVR